jgi:hypothetical protein
MALSEEEINKKALEDSIRSFKERQLNSDIPENRAKLAANSIAPSTTFDNQFQQKMMQETDPDLIAGSELLKLPSEGVFYTNKLSEIMVEYLTSTDEDILTTPSLLENGTVLDVIMKRKIKTPGINIDDLLSGDKEAITLFLRKSSYGSDYKVDVYDPRTGIPFKDVVDLNKLKYKEVKERPDENGCFIVELPMRKKLVKFRLLKSSEETLLLKKAEAIKDAYNTEYNQYNTLKLKAHVVEINGKTDRNYIDKFIDAMPALDSLTIRRKINEVSPGVDMKYEFKAKDGFKFMGNLTVGVDFFFPST